MPDTLPVIAPDTLNNASAQELLDLLIAHADRTPRTLFDACVARGEGMVAALATFYDAMEALDELDNGQWWAQLHGIFILSKLPGEAAGQLLTHALVLADQHEDDNLMDWVAGDWAPLFANKPVSVVERVREVALDVGQMPTNIGNVPISSKAVNRDTNLAPSIPRDGCQVVGKPSNAYGMEGAASWHMHLIRFAHPPTWIDVD